MARSKKKNDNDKKKKLLGALLVLLSLLLLISLVSHHNLDDARITGKEDSQLNPFEIQYRNQGGMMGAYLSYFFTVLLGWLAYFIPLGFIFLALRLFSSKLATRYELNSFVLFVISLFGTMIYNLHFLADRPIGYETGAIGGYVGERLTDFSLTLVGELGSYLILSGFILILLIMYTSITPLLAVRIPLPGKKHFISAYSFFTGLVKHILSFRWLFSSFRRKEKEADEEDEKLFERVLEDEMTPEEAEDYIDDEPLEDAVDDSGREDKKARRKAVIKKVAEPLQVKSIDYKYPGVDLLNENASPEASVNADELNFTARMLKETLETFGVRIDGNIEKFPGPVITRFEFKPAAGIKVNQIINLSDDLALALKAKRIRIIAPIPGKAAVGVEIPNRNPQSVFIREILTSREFRNPDLILPMAIGKTTSGQPYVTDLTKMPHLLIAGATGSGKSVCMNVLITSLIYRLHPLQVRFIFIDPKMLELSVYSGIPHLGRPVVTKSKRAEKVLADTVAEMENRYRKLAGASVRNIEDYNKKQNKAEEKLPYIIIFVDELADLMMSSTSTKTEVLITRLAQMARAVGIHLILATQRPSVDVITGLIKANFPARIAFQVSSKVDSRTIIDANGAEKLLGNGDMLFLYSGQPEPRRIHGAYVSSDETEKIVEFIKAQGLEMLKLESISQQIGEVAESSVDLGDPLFKEACEVVVRHKQGSVSLLQRRLGIGYQRAARLIDRLEEAGIVSPFDGSKARDVIVDKAYIDTLFAGSGSTVSSDSD
ncbi:MAG: DNA translocase FtsK 4TM domain-containing protein [candidate division Zixibacteria bacterium]|nr:DNA translocase FtsK 4TM domain-containing protein [candidate division Zixibacteria bacterium]